MPSPNNGVELFGACAKRRVQAVLVGASGKRYAGENVCMCPQQSCPRAPGEGYEKCKTVCQQLHHAEIQALEAAGDDARGGTMHVNYNRCCEACLGVMTAAGVVNVVLV